MDNARNFIPTEMKDYDREMYLRLEWEKAVREGNKHYAELCRLKYKYLMDSLKEPHNQYIYVLNGWLPIYLN